MDISGLLAFIEVRGLMLEVRPHDVLNPGHGWSASVTADTVVSRAEGATPQEALGLLAKRHAFTFCAEHGIHGARCDDGAHDHRVSNG